MEKAKHAAVIVAGGSGSRMHSEMPKQYLEIAGKPILYYTLRQFENSFMDAVVLVVSKDWIEYCQTEIIEKYQLHGVSAIVCGGKERYDSVYRGLSAVGDCDYVYIHDGARPFLNAQILERAKACVEEYQACAAGMPVKDTIKIVDEHGFVRETPDRNYVWQIQTPQVFSFPLIKEAYEQLYHRTDPGNITDDAMVVEAMLGHPVKLFEGAYENIKITTPEDLVTAENFLRKLKIMC